MGEFLADNRLRLNGDWDHDLLVSELEAIVAAERSSGR